MLSGFTMAATSKIFTFSLLLGPVLGWAGNSATSTLSASDFGSMGPFYECTYKDPSYAAAVNNQLKVYFDETNYDGTRDDRGVEICSNMAPVLKELWHGFSIYVPSDTYPTGKQSIIAQQFCNGYCVSWCGTLSIIGESLVADHRGSCGTPTETTIVSTITRDTWHHIIINARFSNSGDGHYIVWYDDNQVYSAANINLGFDDAWTSDGKMTTGVGFKNGQYNADTSLYTGVTRTLYFDNISWYNVDAGQTDGYNVVNPSV